MDLFDSELNVDDQVSTYKKLKFNHMYRRN